MTHHGKIPRPTIKRLSLYLRELESVLALACDTVNSRQLGDILGLSDAQVRKDLAVFGAFGQPGIGYSVAELVERLRRILGTDRRWPSVLIGAGNIGRAVASYPRLERKGFEIVGVFDNNPAVIGKQVADRTIEAVDQVAKAIRERNVKIGMVAVPADAAQSVADALIKAGVKGILNFAPVRLQVDENFPIVSVDLTVSLEQLAFQISLGRAESDISV